MQSILPRGRHWVPALIAILALAQAAPVLGAQARLRGTVTDISGEPLEGVRATLSSEPGGQHFTETSDAEGSFQFLVVDPTHPPYVLHLEKEGYQSLEEVVQLQANDRTTFEAAMAPAETELPEGEETAGDPEAIELYNEGATLYNEGDLDAAIARFEEAIGIDPSLEPAYRTLQTLYLTQGRYQDALETAERLLELAPGDPEATTTRYDALVGLGRAEEAAQALDDLVETGEPREAAKRVYNVAVHTQKQGDEARALELFRQAVELDPELAQGWAAVAGMELGSNRPEEAVEAAAALLALKPGDIEAMTIQYEAYKMMGETAKADELLARMESESEDPGVLYRRGVALFNASNYDQAVQVLRQAVEADPQLAGAHYTLGLALISKGESDDARDHLQRFLELAPDHADAETARQMLEYLGSDAG